jgi:CBS domain-containing protein
MRARDVMSDGVTSISETATIHEAAKLLVNTHVSALPVLDANGIMVGIVSEADVIKEGTRRDAGALSRRVADVMTRDVATADDTASLGTIAALMIERGVKRIPILRDRKVVGIVSRVDLLRALLSGDADTVAVPSDEALRAAVMAAVSGQSWSLARRADVVAKEGVVHLWGVVPSEAVVERYEAAAANVMGVKAVRVHMHVMQR